jgi:N-acetylglutamate synthase
VLQAGDIGQRVVLRRRAGLGQHGRPLLTDLLGELLAIDDQQVTVRADDGAEHVVALTEVTAAKRIPPRPVRYSEIAALERVADRAWPAPEHEPLGEWLLRAANGFTNRANSALPLGDAGRGLDEAVDACAEWYRARSLTPRITVPLPLRRDVASVLIRRGWHAQPRVLVQTAQLADILAIPVPPAGVRLAERPSAGLLEIITTRKSGLPEAASRILTTGEVRFAEVPGDDTRPVAIARAAVVTEWMHLGLVEVIESARGRGLARAVSQALASWAQAGGASRAFLQVEEHNLPAVRLYGAMGFRTHHTYITYRAPD